MALQMIRLRKTVVTGFSLLELLLATTSCFMTLCISVAWHTLGVFDLVYDAVNLL